MASEERKIDAEQLEELLEEKSSSFNIQTVFKILILNWHWFVLSLVVCLGLAYTYLRYTTPVYEVGAKMLIKDEQMPRRNSTQMLANMQELGFISNSAGIENEMEILQSHVLACQAVKNLKLYVTYRSEGRLVNQLMYQTQPVSVDLDPESLAKFDENLLYKVPSFSLKMREMTGGYHVWGNALVNGGVVDSINVALKSFPASVKTKLGTLTFTENTLASQEETQDVAEEEKDAEAAKKSANILIDILPPMLVARGYVGSMSVQPTSKMTSIAQITLRDQDPRRAIDYVTQLANCYNEQANADKNEIAMKTEEFINERLQKIDKELGATEGAIEDFKRRNSMTDIRLDATQSLTQSNQYQSKLAEANSQIELIDYLREFVDNPEHKYEIIPSNVGLSDGASTSLIAQYNQKVLDRSRLLKSVSEMAPQVLTLTSTIDEMRSSIRTALLQARRSAYIVREGIERQYSIYRNRISSTPEQERVLNQIGRQQEVRSGLYLLLLQKREENSISLAATADKGRLIDVPQFRGKVSPKSSMIYLIALVIGLALPMGLFFLLQLMRYKIEGHDDVASITRLPIVADVAVASDSVKSSAGIVVHADTNDQIDEIFRSMRTNIQFMMSGDQKVILFTSSISGEGKTFNAANLAVSFALLGKKVILCGLDIRKPALGRLFSIQDRQQGITNLLTKPEVKLDDLKKTVVSSGVNDNLDLLLAGPTPPNPTELLARDAMAQVVKLLRQEYDYVIFDTAPVGLVADTFQISKHSDVVVYVCRADYTPKANLAMVNSLMEEKKLPENTCIVLNGVDLSKKKYGYYYGYGRYGKYSRYSRYSRYGHYGRYGGYGGYGSYGSYGSYADSHYGNREDRSLKK